MKIVIIDNYDSFTYNIVQYLGELHAEPLVFRNDQIDTAHIRTIGPNGIIVSSGPGMPENAGASGSLVREFSNSLPILGIGLGHQVIAHVFGARIASAPMQIHGKASTISHGDDPIFFNVPNPFLATRYHSYIVDRDSVVAPLCVTAESNDGLVMGIKHVDHPVYGFQFHPESILTTHGLQLFRNFLLICTEQQTIREVGGNA